MSKCSTSAVLPRPVTKIICSIPASRASSTAYWISGRSTTGSNSFGIALVAGRKRVPSPATGNTALRIGLRLLIGPTDTAPVVPVNRSGIGSEGVVVVEPSSISAVVEAANSKLARFLRAKEDEEMLLRIGKRRPKELKEQRRTRGSRARWSAEPDFKVPTCMVDRPRTSTGATSFHFSYISISKQAFPTVGGKPIEGAMGKVRNAALDHAKYIERDGAAEVTSLAHANYIERPDAIENLDPSALIEEAIERQIASVGNETPTDEEAQLLGLRDVVPDGIPSVFSNISNDPFERQEYWRAVERCERVPRMHQLILDPEVSPRWWAALETASHLDPEFKNHALTVQEQHRQHMAAPVPEGEARKPFKPAPLPVNAERAGKLLQQAMHMPGFDPALPPVEFKSGRGGRIQIRFV